MSVENRITGILNQEERERYDRDGYLLIEDPGWPESVPDGIIADLDGRYFFEGGSREVDGVLYSGARNPRIRDAWKISENVKSLAIDAKILGILEELYGRRPLPFQTLNFPVGTQQRAHSDAMHFASVPPGHMCGVWVALEDIDMDNGPLIYYPGSHKLPEVDYNAVGFSADKSEYPDYDAFVSDRNKHYEEFVAEEIIKKHDLKPEYATISRGHAFIWSSNLVHGGAAQRDKNRTRHSQVSHYFFEGCRYYTPMLTEGDKVYWKDPDWIT